jgi:hypothetical protein
MILCITGHREERCDESKVREYIRRELEQTRPDFTTCGMANGTDLWSAAESIDLGIGVICAKPWTTHRPRRSDKELYEFVERSAAEVYIVAQTNTFPGNWCYQLRNIWMVDRSNEVLGIWDGTPKGGTFNCLEYARKDTEKPYKYIHPDTGIVTDGRALSKQGMVTSQVS